jgi:predicted DNA binding CopG/RHH family protein
LKEKPYIVNGERVSLEEYRKTKFEDLRIRVRIGQRDIIKAHAEKKGLSLNAYINELIAADMGDDLMLTERKE